MSNGVNPLNLGSDISPLVQRLGRHADLNRDGHVTGPEFAQYLDQVLNPDQPAGPSLKVAAPYGDRLVGFDVTPSSSPTASVKARVAAIAQYLPPTSANMSQIAKELGPSAGVLSPDGLSMMLAGGQGSFGVRDQANGPVWQWMAHDMSLPAGFEAAR